MEFTYESYKKLLLKCKELNYSFSFFNNLNNEKNIICRHDIDMSLLLAMPIAEIENQLDIKSTYFVLLSTNFYNLFSLENRKILKKIQDYGHEIGLHFDASIYSYNTTEELEQFIKKEVKVLETLINKPIRVISFHRPIKELFNVKLDFITSAYEPKFFSGYEYISDSRRFWKDDPYITLQQEPMNIQLLTHPIWYCKNQTNSATDAIERLNNTIEDLINESLKKNITEYDKFLKGRN